MSLGRQPGTAVCKQTSGTTEGQRQRGLDEESDRWRFLLKTSVRVSLEAQQPATEAGGRQGVTANTAALKALCPVITTTHRDKHSSFSDLKKCSLSLCMSDSLVSRFYIRIKRPKGSFCIKKRKE